MSKKNRHIEHLTPELIKAYRNGELTREEQHEVERLMLENPLYEDALEGLDEFTDEMLNADLNELDSRLDSLLSEEEQKTGFWTIWRGIAAAAVLILAVSSLFLLKQDQPLPNKLLTENKELKRSDTIPRTSQAEPPTDSAAQKPLDEVEDETEVELLFDEEPEEVEPIQIDRIKADASRLIAESLAEFKDDSINLVLPMNQLDPLMEKAIAEIEMERALDNKMAEARSMTRMNAMAAPAPPLTEINLLTIKGTVIGSDDGLPLPQVTVLKKGTTEGTSTNLEGKFTVENVPQNSILAFRYLGYITQEVTIDTATTLEIKLEPNDTALGEVVVVGYGIAEKKELTFSNDKASPINGYPEFNNYLKNNLEYPEEAQKENIRGRVTLEFTVQADGSLTNFEIIKGLGYGCDEEAIRLIKEGPKWLAKTDETKAVSSKVRIRIRFRP